MISYLGFHLCFFPVNKSIICSTQCLERLDRGKTLTFSTTSRHKIYITRTSNGHYIVDEYIHDHTDLASLPQTVSKEQLVSQLDNIIESNKYKLKIGN
jgi:hypothetical protein